VPDKNQGNNTPADSDPVEKRPDKHQAVQILRDTASAARVCAPMEAVRIDSNIADAQAYDRLNTRSGTSEARPQSA
jgi:hypothetical protein